jgi:ApbE superfamily uncharacterized protein (UPF0280 family)
MAIESNVPHPHSYCERSYRSTAGFTGLSFTVQVEESDLWINIIQPGLKNADLQSLAYERLLHYRTQLTAFLQRYPDWGTSLIPVAADDYSFAPTLLQVMMAAAEKAGVGPMAAVAGALSEAVGRDLQSAAAEVVIENGGDIFLAGRREYRLAIFAGSSPLSGRVGLKLVKSSPFCCGVCTSSGRVGHSLSFGRADAVTIVGDDCALADAVATAMANRVQQKSDLAQVMEKALAIDGVTGAVAIYKDGLAVGGQVELVEL